MIALQLTSLKIFMYKLLAQDAFDEFLLEEATIRTANTFTIDGHMNKDFFLPEEHDSEALKYDMRPWSEIKGLCFDLIKGKHTPLSFKFILHLKPEACARLLQDSQLDETLPQLKSLAVNIRYDGNIATLTTGVAYSSFILNKEADNLWDKEIQHFLSSGEIPFEIMQ